MINQITKIQLVGSLQGYLDVAEAVPVPMTYSVGDIRDISKRTGAFSKSIVLPNTKNNANLLNHYFDINIQAGTFNINKLQECILLQNNIPVTQNAYIQLVNVKKIQNVQTEDDFVQYEVLIKDNVSDFFSKLGGSELQDLDFSSFIHSYTSDNIIASYDNTWQDGYKYVLPWIDTPSATLPKYMLSELKPAIYAKQFWDKIHADAGFSYSWSTIAADNVRFDKCLIPYNASDDKLTEETLEALKVIATTSPGTTDYEPFPPMTNQNYAWYKTITFPVEVLDTQGFYTPGQSKYTCAYNLNAPQGYDVVFDVDYDLIFDNTNVIPAYFQGSGQYQPYVHVLKNGSGVYTPKQYIGPATQFAYYNVGLTSLPATSLPPGENITYSINSQFSQTYTQFSQGNYMNFRIGLWQFGGGVNNWVDLYGNDLPNSVQPIIRVRSIKMTININASTLVYGFPINLNSYIPKKIKKSDFVKSICMMYNLFVETDPNDPNRLIYKHRDQFYDTGNSVDWTDKLAKDRDQDLKFLPELSRKRMILTYKEDKDNANTTYTAATKEIYGQQEVIFQNEYIKGIETKELIFSASPVQNTGFGTVNPLYNGQSPNTNIRILLDNGQKTCGQYQIQNSINNIVTVSTYPQISHFDNITNPGFDLNFGICDFYFYDIVNTTQNNLYNNFWRRTMAQIDQGKLLTAYFALDETDIAKMRLNDKIRIDNSYWNINKIIDYNAGSNQLTKVELMSVDPDLNLPGFGRVSVVKPGYVVSSPFKPLLP